jgi:NAD(P)H-dependent FMN reductase
MKILVILGSIREGRVGDKVADWVMEQASNRSEAKYELFDLKEHPMKLFAEPGHPAMFNGKSSDENANKFIEKVAASDGFLIITPEYNRGTSSALKNAIDYPYNEWGKKPVAFVGYGGMSGGGRAVEQLRLNSIELQAVPVREGILIQFVSSRIKDGKLEPDRHLDSGLQKTFEQLEWYAKVLKNARENL